MRVVYLGGQYQEAPVRSGETEAGKEEPHDVCLNEEVTEAESCWGPLRNHRLREDKGAVCGPLSWPHGLRVVLVAWVLQVKVPVRALVPKELLQLQKVAWWRHQVCLAPHWCPRTLPQHGQASGQQGPLRGTWNCSGRSAFSQDSPVL